MGKGQRTQIVKSSSFCSTLFISPFKKKKLLLQSLKFRQNHFWYRFFYSHFGVHFVLYFFFFSFYSNLLFFCIKLNVYMFCFFLLLFQIWKFQFTGCAANLRDLSSHCSSLSVASTYNHLKPSTNVHTVLILNCFAEHITKWTTKK